MCILHWTVIIVLCTCIYSPSCHSNHFKNILKNIPVPIHFTIVQTQNQCNAIVWLPTFYKVSSWVNYPFKSLSQQSSNIFVTFSRRHNSYTQNQLFSLSFFLLFCLNVITSLLGTGQWNEAWHWCRAE